MGEAPSYHPQSFEIPWEVMSVCEDWHNGPRTEMYRLSRYIGGMHPVINWDRLKRELDKTIAGNIQGDEEAKRLYGAMLWVLPYALADRAAKKMEKLAEAALVAGVEPQQFEAAVQHGIANAQRAVSAAAADAA